MDNPIIEIHGIKKKYRLGSIGGGTLTEDIQSWWAKLRGKEDPNVKVGDTPLKNEEFWALKGIDFNVYKGEAVGIIGINGAGKSTLLKILSRVTAPTEGEVILRGKLTSMLEVGTGFHSELTGRQNVYMNGAILGMKPKEIEERMNEIINFSEVGKFIDTPVKRYSSGMYVKLAFSVAAHLNSDIMIMDEVLAVGDAVFQKKCLDKMRGLAENSKRTILYVSHNMTTVRKLCDRCIVLDKGELIYDGKVDEAIKKYLGTKKDEHKNYFDFKDYHRRMINYCNTGKLELQFIKIQGVEANYIEAGSKLVLKLGLSVRDEIEKFAVRCILHTKDGYNIGIAISDLVECYKKGFVEYEFIIDISNLAPNQYVFNFVFFNPNDFGKEIKYDIVEDAMWIDVISTKNKFHNLDWSTYSWGYYAFPVIDFKRILK